MTLLSALAGDPDIENLLSDQAQLDAMLAFERALAEASANAGFIAEGAAVAIGAALDGYTPDWSGLKAGMVRDGVVVPALVKQLKATLAEPHRDALHKGATSQDVIDTALMLQLARVFDVYETRLSTVIDRIAALETEHDAREMMAHTRMQVALPTTWGAKLISWSEPLRRHLRTLVAMRRSLLVIQLGGPVGDRKSFGDYAPAIATGMAKRLDLGMATPWQTARDPIMALGGLLTQITGSLGKLGMDVTLLAQNEVAALRLEGGGGSSAMAHKSNPVKAEVLVALARYNAGLSGTLAQAQIHEYERSGAAWTLEWLTLPPMLVATGASLKLVHDLLAQIRIG